MSKAASVRVCHRRDAITIVSSTIHPNLPTRNKASILLQHAIVLALSCIYSKVHTKLGGNGKGNVQVDKSDPSKSEPCFILGVSRILANGLLCVDM